MIPMEKLLQQVHEHPYPLLFSTLSGAHLYGFPSPDSDFDLRGAHILPLPAVVGMKLEDDTVERSGIREGLEIDLVTHDVCKFFGMLLKKNGYVLEQVLSPIVIFNTPEFEELQSIARRCVTRHHSHHYLGFAATQWKLFEKESPRRVKPLLYVFRVLLTGIHLMKTGEVQANLEILNEEARLSYLHDLMQRKKTGPEKGTLSESDFAFYSAEYQRLTQTLETAAERSHLPETPSTAAELNDFLIRIRLAGWKPIK